MHNSMPACNISWLLLSAHSVKNIIAYHNPLHMELRAKIIAAMFLSSEQNSAALCGALNEMGKESWRPHSSSLQDLIQHFWIVGMAYYPVCFFHIIVKCIIKWVSNWNLTNITVIQRMETLKCQCFYKLLKCQKDLPLSFMYVILYGHKLGLAERHISDNR